MQRKRSRSSSGTRVVLGLREHAPVELELPELAVEEMRRREMRAFTRLGCEVGLFCHGDAAASVTVTVTCACTSGADSFTRMARHDTLAAVDLGSNSFHLQIGRVVDDQIYPLDSLRETVRLGAGLTADKRIDRATQARALEALASASASACAACRAQAVRAVGTNTLRVAKNAPQFLREARAALGFPIEVISGREEARLIYLGVAHSLPLSRAQPPGGRHRRRLDRVHHRHRARAAAHREPLHGLRELQPDATSPTARSTRRA